MSSPARSRGAAGGATGGAADGAGVARLAASQLRRMRRIVDAAVALAEAGGFDGVRLRDVAEASDVALGTLYKYFRSKEDILLFAVNEEARRLEESFESRPPEGATALARLDAFFGRATRALTRKPGFARAVLRSIGTGDDPGTVLKIAGFHLRMTRMTLAVLRGEALASEEPLTPLRGTRREQDVAITLQLAWYASLVGWSGSLHPAKEVLARMHRTAELLLGGE
jgi:AcrR family transcriptional regulator